MTITDYLNNIKITSQSIKSEDYLKLGISEEYGEIIGKVKRYCRGDYGKEEFKTQIKKELGDLTYYVAVYEEMTHNVRDFRQPKNLRLKNNLHNLAALNAHINNAKNPRHIRLALHSLMNNITDLAWNFGLTMDEITQANVDKIRSRFNRNMIRGSGDER